MLNELDNLVNEEKWEEARSLIAELELELKPSDRFAILNATVYMEEGKLEEAYQCITIGIICNPSNYELYYLLGNYYLNRNVNQAYLCYEQALFYCSDDEGRKRLEENMEFVSGLDGFEVHPVSIVIPSYNEMDRLKRCIDSIQKNHNESMYELVVVDNASTDGTDQWLKEQSDIILQCNTVNEGYIKGCNQGIELADSQNDIFLLHNDTIVPPNALFWLRMGLYKRDTVGAVSPVTNNASTLYSNNQEIKISCDTAEEYLELAESLCIPMQHSQYENKIYLADFALLIKRRAINEVGMFDERYEFAGCEEADYGMMLSVSGYECLICKNSFIYHYGSFSIVKESNKESMENYSYHLQRNIEALIKKWGMYPFYYVGANTHLIEEIQKEQDTCFRVLEVGCACGATLSHIKWKYPNARAYGIELEEKVAKMGKYMAEITVGDIETMELPYAKNMFDYIFFGDVLEHLRDPGQVLARLGQYLRADGKVIASIPNLLNKSIIAPLLRGKFEYASMGLLDATHIHLFTKQEIERMFFTSGFKITKITANTNAEQWRMEEGDEEIIDAICRLPGVVAREEFEAYQYLIEAELQHSDAGEM